MKIRHRDVSIFSSGTPSYCNIKKIVKRIQLGLPAGEINLPAADLDVLATQISPITAQIDISADEMTRS